MFIYTFPAMVKLLRVAAFVALSTAAVEAGRLGDESEPQARIHHKVHVGQNERVANMEHVGKKAHVGNMKQHVGQKASVKPPKNDLPGTEDDLDDGDEEDTAPLSNPEAEDEDGNMPKPEGMGDVVDEDGDEEEGDVDEALVSATKAAIQTKEAAEAPGSITKTWTKEEIKAAKEKMGGGGGRAPGNFADQLKTLHAQVSDFQDQLQQMLGEMNGDDASTPNAMDNDEEDGAGPQTTGSKPGSTDPAMDDEEEDSPPQSALSTPDDMDDGEE
eukprot:TRINITY_DN14647_c1_g2_i1.p1 TRINITY_DN14647_c1_g2~~TRINITY_DN14647_c1_g2_i1.p1  ORF type:complete len:272 (-),score=86.60 TRINITY_DN14647_c1_g2_i1:142-957(-)